MKPVIIVLTNSDSGLYDFRKEILTALLENGYEVVVSVPDTGYADRITALGCVVVQTQMERRGMNPVRDLKLLLFYRRLIRSRKPVAVLTYTIKPNIYGGMACRLTRTPYLANVTGLGTALEHKGLLQKVIVRLYRAGLHRACCVFFQNKGNQSFMEHMGCVTTRSRVIPGSGVNLSEHEPLPYPTAGEPIRFLSIMRVMKDKGINELLRAAQTVHQQYPDTEFQILGAYEEETRNYYQPVIEDLQKQGVIQYYGYRDDVPEFIRNCQAVVHPSYHEGMSNVLLEAAASARPVLASDVEGCIDTFEDGFSGIAFRPADADNLTGALLQFLELSVEDRARMGLLGRAYVEKRFDRRLVIEAYLEEIKKIADSG